MSFLPKPHAASTPDVDPVATDPHRDALRLVTSFREDADTSLARLATGGTGAHWLVNRVADHSYTVLANDGSHPDADGTSVPWSTSLCSTLLRDRDSAVACDLLAAGPELAERAAAWGLRGYVGVRLTDADGRLLGTLCGFSPDPLPEQPAHGSALVARGLGDALGDRLDRALQAIRHGREADRGSAMRTQDALTGLPDRRGWGVLLDREDNRCRHLAEPSGVVLVDVGPVRTARALRRAVAAVVEAAGDDVVVARLGGRQLGLLCAGRPSSSVSRTAQRVSEQLHLLGVGTTTFAMREGTSSLLDTWWRAESQLLAARSGARAA